MLITNNNEKVTFYRSKMLLADFMQYRPRVTYSVYILTLQGARIKVGMSKNLHQRIRDYTTISPDLSLTAAFFLDNKEQAEMLEKEILAHYHSCRVGNSEVLELPLGGYSDFMRYLETIASRYSPANEVKNHSQLEQFNV